MSAPTLSRRDRRVLLLGVAIVMTLLLGARGIPAWLGWQREARAGAAELHAEAARALASVRGAASTHDSLIAREVRYLALVPGLLEGDSPASAAAALSSLLSGAAETEGVRVGSLQLRRDSTSRGAFTRVAVQASLIGDIRSLTSMLTALEQGPELLAIRELSVTQPDVSAGDDRPEMLRVELLVEGLVLNRRTRGKR